MLVRVSQEQGVGVERLVEFGVYAKLELLVRREMKGQSCMFQPLQLIADGDFDGATLV